MMRLFFFLYCGSAAVAVGWLAREAFLEGSIGIGIVLSLSCACFILSVWETLK